MFALGRNLNLSYVVKPLMQIIDACLEYDFVTDKRPLNAIYELFLAKLSQSVLCDTIALILVKITSLKSLLKMVQNMDLYWCHVQLPKWILQSRTSGPTDYTETAALIAPRATNGFK